MPVPNILGFTAPVRAEDWKIMTLALGPSVARYDLCEDCAEVLVEQFMVGATVAPITQPLNQVILPHDPMTDCQLVWNPGKGAFLCYHDDPELYHALIIDNAQNVAEGVPERPVRVCSECGCAAHRKFGPCSSTGCECTLGLREKIEQVAADVKTAGYAHSIPQRCKGDVCSEQHTYTEGCILAGVVSPPEKSLPCNHIYPGTPCDWNECKTPGRLISQHGEDLTEAYSEQEPAE